MQARRERLLQRQLSDLMGQWQKAVCSACLGGGLAGPLVLSAYGHAILMGHTLLGCDTGRWPRPGLSARPSTPYWIKRFAHL